LSIEDALQHGVSRVFQLIERFRRLHGEGRPVPAQGRLQRDQFRADLTVKARQGADVPMPNGTTILAVKWPTYQEILSRRTSLRVSVRPVPRAEQGGGESRRMFQGPRVCNRCSGCKPPLAQLFKRMKCCLGHFQAAHALGQLLGRQERLEIQAGAVP
jgi:hypothetical protein